MFKFKDMPKWFRVTLGVFYFAWILGAAGLALVTAFMGMFQNHHVSVGTEEVVLLAVALVGPLIPFVSQITIPNGPQFSFREDATGAAEAAIEVKGGLVAAAARLQKSDSADLEFEKSAAEVEK